MDVDFLGRSTGIMIIDKDKHVFLYFGGTIGKMGLVLNHSIFIIEYMKYNKCTDYILK